MINWLRGSAGFAPSLPETQTPTSGRSIYNFTASFIGGIIVGVLALSFIAVASACILVALAVIAVFSSVASIIAFPFIVIASLIVGGKYLYHNQHTKNAQGQPIREERDYKNPHTVFAENDINKLKHEKKRLECENHLVVLKFLTQIILANMIPIINLIAHHFCITKNQDTIKNQLKESQSDWIERKTSIDTHIAKLTQKA